MTSPLASPDLVLPLLVPVRDHLAVLAASPPVIAPGWRGPAAEAARAREVDVAESLRAAADLAAVVVDAVRGAGFGAPSGCVAP